MGTPALLRKARLRLCCSVLILACLHQHQAHYHLPSVLFWQASAVSVSTLQNQHWMFSCLTSPRWLTEFPAVTSNKDVNHSNTQIGEGSLLSLIVSFIHSSVTSYLLFSVYLVTHTFLRMWSWVPSVLEHCTNVLYMNWPFLCRLWQLGFFFFFFWEGGVFRLLPGQTAAPFPCLRLQQCSLVLRPPPLNVSTHVSTSPSHFLSLHLTVGLLPRGPLCLSAAHLHISLVYVSRHLYFCAADWQLHHLVNTLPHSQKPHNSSPSPKNNNTS